MNNKELNRMLAVLAFLAAAIVLAMVAGILTTHMSQDFFQSARPVGDLAARVTESPGNVMGLRLNLGLDNFLIVVYSVYFVLLAVRFRDAMDPWLRAIGLGAMLLTAFLDMIENHHIMTMLHSIERGLPFSAEEAGMQMVLTLVKFHCSYVGLVLFAFGYWKQGALGRTVAGLLAFGYVPLGILMMALPVEIVKPVALIRVCFFVIAFVLSGTLFMRSASRENSRA
ncbi:MAG TPA: hypothetical protein VIF60_07170 [Burkholderiaceae bacterium]|jgi:hypothetical protein